jgi:hypothetical protein
MDLASVSNAPRAIVVGGQTYRARTLTLGQIGEVLAWLQDRMGGDPVLFSSEASRVALATTEGLSVLLHLSLLSCHPSLTRDGARVLAGSMDADDEAKLLSIAFHRVPGKPADPDAPPPKDLAEINWGEMFEWLGGHTARGFEDAASLTLNQLDCFATKGEAWDPDEMTPAQVQKMWEEAQAVDPNLEVATSG